MYSGRFPRLGPYKHSGTRSGFAVKLPSYSTTWRMYKNVQCLAAAIKRNKLRVVRIFAKSVAPSQLSELAEGG